MTLLAKAAAVGIAGAVTAMLLRRTVPELSLALGLAVCLMAAGLALELMSGLAELYDIVRDNIGLSPAVVTPVLKCVGIGIVTRLSADLCRDAGQTAVGAAVELCGAACAMVTALPLIRAMLQMIGEIS